MTTPSTFERYEKKYLLTPDQCIQLQCDLCNLIEPDQYGQYTTNSIYFDTPDYQLIRASMEGPVYKEKLRIRSYGVPGNLDPVFVELKKKYKGIVYKRRITLTCEETMQWFHHPENPPQAALRQPEFLWFLKRYPLQPSVWIGYDRQAYTGRVDPTLRVTFDRNLRWRSSALDLRQGDWGNPICHTNQILMEVKVAQAVPLELSHAMDALKLRPVSFSKYATCYKEHLLQDFIKKGATHCA